MLVLAQIDPVEQYLDPESWLVQVGRQFCTTVVFPLAVLADQPGHSAISQS